MNIDRRMAEEILNATKEVLEMKNYQDWLVGVANGRINISNKPRHIKMLDNFHNKYCKEKA